MEVCVQKQQLDTSVLVHKIIKDITVKVCPSEGSFKILFLYFLFKLNVIQQFQIFKH